MKVYGQSTKESYRSDIDDSLKHKTVYKNYEYFDDHSYGTSKKMGFYLESKDGKLLLYLFQEDGPRDKETLTKLLEWRRSGDSDEIGHKGGGNKRNIYGFHSDKTVIFMKVDDTNVLKCETKPNKLYNLSVSDIDEESFRGLADTSEYINTPDTFNIDDLPRWYSDTFEKIKNESGIEPNYLIRMELSEIPEEYSNEDSWNEYINQVRAKQYGIPIYFKNEVLLMNDYNKYDKIDLVGFDDPNKVDEMRVPLYIHRETKYFYMKEDEKFVNVKDPDDSINNSESLCKWGEIRMFITAKQYFNEELKKYNDRNPNKLKAENFYGIYLIINDKLTNYLPVEGDALGSGKNNKISDGECGNTNRFRMIIIPDKETCQNSKLFDALIQTCEIKALSGFLDKSPWKKISKYSMNIFKGETITKSEKPTPKPKEKEEVTKPGGIYLVYLGGGLFKYGCVEEYKNMKSRLNNHSCKSIENVKKFCEKDMKLNKRVTLYEKKTSHPKGDEEEISKILEKNKSNKITLFECERSTNKVREYFICNDFDYINDYICSLLNDVLESS